MTAKFYIDVTMLYLNQQHCLYATNVCLEIKRKSKNTKEQRLSEQRKLFF